MLNNFNKKLILIARFNIFCSCKDFLKMLLSLALLMDGINLILTSGNTRKMGPRTISWDEGPTTMGNNSKIGPWGETLRGRPTVGP